MVGYIRFAALALIGLSYLGFRLKKKKDHQSETLENDWSQYQKMKRGCILGKKTKMTLHTELKKQQQGM